MSEGYRQHQELMRVQRILVFPFWLTGKIVLIIGWITVFQWVVK